MPSDGAVIYAVDRDCRQLQVQDSLPGHILVADISGNGTAQVSRNVLGARRARPWAPLVIVAASKDREHLIAAGALGAQVGARAVTSALHAEWPQIIRQLCNGDGDALGQHCAQWIAIQRPKLSQVAIKRLERLIAAGASGGHVHDVAADLDITVRNLEDYFHRAALPPPARYVQFGRLMPGVCLLARRPGIRLVDAADAAGYSTGSAFIRGMTRTLRIRAADVRKRIGFEWAAHQMELHYHFGDRAIELK